MSNETTVLYNSSCPVCAHEIGIYRAYSEGKNLPLDFRDIDAGDLAAFGLTPDDAARRLHVIDKGEVVAGIPAFIALWSKMPRFRWLARIVSLPVIHPLAVLIYEYLLAPVLYYAHKRRQRRAAST
ncbi:MAG: DUF393 domain-containing protein [Pseudomonadota bacterium]